MTRNRLLGVLLFVALVAFTLWLSWPPTLSPRPVNYTCANGDTITVVALDTGRVQLLHPDSADAPLQRRPSPIGTTYDDSTSGVLFWARGPYSVLHQDDRVLHYGCTALRDPSEKPDTLRWYASGDHARGWRFALSHPADVRISRPNQRYTRFLHVGPRNEPPALTDGFSVVVGLHCHRGPLREYVDKAIESPPDDRRVLSSPTDTTHRGRRAVIWRQVSAMDSSVDHWAVALDSSTVATVAISVTGPASERDRQRARQMRQSLRFWQQAPARTDSTSVPLAMLKDPNGQPDRGCDQIHFIRHRIPPTAHRVSAAVEALFSIQQDSVDGARHFLSQTNDTLQFDRLRTQNDTAHVYLTGRLSGLRGVCDNPRARIQIEETLRRLLPIRDVQFYLNGTQTDLQPDGRGASS